MSSVSSLRRREVCNVIIEQRCEIVSRREDTRGQKEGHQVAGRKDIRWQKEGHQLAGRKDTRWQGGRTPGGRRNYTSGGRRDVIDPGRMNLAK